MQPTILNERYKIEAKIGEGGMAVVYRGYDVRLNRTVAIKVLRSHYSNDADFLSRFQHEAQAAAILNHPYVVKVYDVGRDGDTHYIVMEFVSGEDLKTIINREAPLSVPYAVAIAEAVAYGLEAAHQLGLIHRDIKPQNILVAPDGHVRITDFGIAKSHLSTSLTQAGMTFGTADYISPEQARGQLAGPQSDIYALGVTLFEMLTGRLPFVGTGALSVVMQHIGSEPPRLRQFNPLVPPQLEALVLRAMTKDPHQRPISARVFAQQLQKYRGVAEQQTVVLPAPAEYRDREYHTGSGTVMQHTGNSVALTIPAGTATPTLHRPAMMPPARAVASRPPQQQGHGCGIALIASLLILWMFGVVTLFALPVMVRSSQRDGVVITVPTPLIYPTSTEPSNVAPSPSPQRSATPVDQEEQLVPEPSRIPTLTPTTPPTATPVPPVQVPNVVGLAESDAQLRLRQANLVPVLLSTIFDPEIPQGFVVSQSVLPGTDVSTGSEVGYSISQGPQIVLVPDLVNLAVGIARNELEQLGLRVAFMEEPHATVPKDRVIRHEPEARERVKPGDTIFLAVSMGDVVRFPDVIGLPREQAVQILLHLNLNLEYVDVQQREQIGESFDQIAPNTVVSAMADGSPIGNGAYIPRLSRIVLGVRAPNESTPPGAGLPQGSAGSDTGGVLPLPIQPDTPPFEADHAEPNPLAP